MMFLMDRGYPYGLHRRERRRLQPRQHNTMPTTVAALLHRHGDREAPADIDAAEMDEKEARVATPGVLALAYGERKQARRAAPE
jgi:hypothetical protein